MKKSRGYFTLLMSLFSFVMGVSAQNIKEIEVKGKVLDEKGLPIAYATVLVANKASTAPITGTTTTMEGDFSFQIKVDNVKEFYVEVSYIGFKKLKINDFRIENSAIHLGNITLYEDMEKLNEVVVMGEKSSTEFRLDKRVFNVGKELTNNGATALQVLNNVPSVSVNIEGRVSLRGSQGVQILINGKPSVLTSGDNNALGTVTADMIQSVEVITNPSAKYEAEGTSGIINIILKKESKQGVNGSVTLNTGIPNNHSLGLSINRRTEKWNLFGQLGIGKRTFPKEVSITNHDYVNSSLLEVTGDEERNEKFYSINLGADFYPSKLSVLTLSGRYAFEKEDANSDFLYTATNTTDSSFLSWNRNEDTKADNPKFEYELQYKKDFDEDQEHNLQLSALGSYFQKDSNSEYVNTYINSNRERFFQQMVSDYMLAEYTFKADYSLPLGNEMILEAGSQYVLTSVTNDFEVLDRQSDSWVVNPNYTNVFEYDQNVLGAYTTLAYEQNQWGVKLGLRMEQTNLNTLLVNNYTKNKQEYHDWFPTMHASYNLTESLSFQAGYSKRVKRPDLWDLNPFYSLKNDYDVFVGNPDLRPEYTNSFELTMIKKLQNLSLNFGVYNRDTRNVMENIINFSENVSIITPENVGKNNTTGVEFNAKYTGLRWLTLNADFNYNYFKRNGSHKAMVFNFNGNQWQSKLMTKYKLPANIDLEVIANYESKYKNLQYTLQDNLYADIGIRKKILKGKLIVNANIRDVFASRVFNPITVSEQNFSLNKKEKDGRFVTVGISFGFGKGEAMEFSGVKSF